MKFSTLQTLLAVSIVLIVGIFLGYLAQQPKGDMLDVEVTGDFAAPVAVKVHGKIPDYLQKDQLIKGDGAIVSEGAQVLFRVSNFAYTRSQYLTVLNDATVKSSTARKEDLGELYPLIENMREGSRIVAVFPEKNRASAEIVVLDILPTVIRGENKAAGTLPSGISVETDEKGIPTVSAQGGVFAQEQIATLIHGEGEQIVNGDKIYANYLIADSSGNLQESTYGNSTLAFIDTKQVFSGLSRAIIDQRIGSRVVAAIPSTEARGSGDVIIVLDILARASHQNSQGGS